MDDFLFIAEHPALDFVNTEVWEDGRVDRIHSDADLWRWAERALELSRSAEPRVGLDPQIRAVRGDLRAVFEAELDGRDPDPDALAHLDEIARARPPFRFDGDYGRADPETVAQVLAVIVDSAFDLLASDRRDRLHACEGERCILLFVDRSRAGRRKWCSMKVCGNRAKVAAHRRAHGH